MQLLTVVMVEVFKRCMTVWDSSGNLGSNDGCPNGHDCGLCTDKEGMGMKIL